MLGIRLLLDGGKDLDVITANSAAKGYMWK